MGSYNGAEICELVGLYLLEELTNIIPKESVGLYRDDGHAILPNTSGPETERLKKKIRKLFKNNKLKITIEAGMHQTDFLDVTFNASTGKYWPFRKLNSILQYIHTQSNHPSNIRKQLPTMIEKRLSSIACDKNEFNKAAPTYNQALEKSGYKHNLAFQATKTEKTRNRKRNITWFNPPYSNNVSTNAGKNFLRLLDKHFPPNHKFHPIFNRNCVKISYSCMPNMASIIKSHNAKLMKPTSGNPIPHTSEATCNCRNKDHCPLNGNCTKSCIVYQATVTSGKQSNVYFGSCSTTFKARFNNHTSSFRHRSKAASTELSKHVWKLKDSNRHYNITWNVVKHATPFRSGAKACGLCLAEKLQIMQAKPGPLLNKRSELVSKCRHKAKFLLKNFY